MTMNIQGEEARSRVGRRLQNVWLHDVADRLRLRRKSIASADGLDPRDVEPYPISGDVTIVNQGGGALKSALMTAALLAGGGGGALGLASLAGWLTPPAATAPAEPSAGDTAQADPALPAAQAYRVTFWAEDGTQIEVDPQP